MNVTSSKSSKICTNLSEYNYDLPRELIAQQPLQNREDARLLILHRSTGKIEHRTFHEITEYLHHGDFLVLNNTKVIPASVTGKRISGAFLELLLTEQTGENQWKALIKSNARLKTGEEIYIGNNIISISAKLINKAEDGSWLITFDKNYDIKDILVRIGKMPLPPYIKRNNKKEAYTLSIKNDTRRCLLKRKGQLPHPQRVCTLAKTPSRR